MAQWKALIYGQRAHEFEVVVGFRPSQSMMKMCDMQDESEFPALVEKEAQESD